MPQAGIHPPAQSHAFYEASALPPSHHGWIFGLVYPARLYHFVWLDSWFIDRKMNIQVISNIVSLNDNDDIIKEICIRLTIPIFM